MLDSKNRPKTAQQTRNSVPKVGAAVAIRPPTSEPQAANEEPDKLDSVHETGKFSLCGIVVPDFLNNGIFAPSLHHSLRFIFVINQHWA